MTLEPPHFEHYDPKLAEAITRNPLGDTGLHGFLGFEATDVGPGRLVVELAVRDDLLTPFGNLHGGVIAALCDHVLGSVLYPVIPRGAWAATTEFKVNYLAPVQRGILRAEATIVSMTKRTAVVRIDVTNDDRAVSVAQGTVLVMEAKR